MLHNETLHYLDNAATTMVDPAVAEVIYTTMLEHWANPSSLYAPGAASEEALNRARADADIVLLPGSSRGLVCFGRVIMHALPLPGKA